MNFLLKFVLVFKGEKYSEYADVFSFGMVLYELVSGFEPHKGILPLKFAGLMAYEDYRPNLPPITEKWENLITTCWQKDPCKRSSFKVLLTEIKIGKKIPRKFSAGKFIEISQIQIVEWKSISTNV
jgi:serine/threonine protein kinase